MDHDGLSIAGGWGGWRGLWRDLVEQFSTASLDAAIERRGRVELIWEALDGLPVRHAEAFILRYAEELRHREIAERLQVTEGRARKLVGDAREKIREKLVLLYLRVEIHSESLSLHPEDPVNLVVRLHNDESLSVPNLKVQLRIGMHNLGQQTVRVRPHDSVMVQGFSCRTPCGVHQSLTTILSVGRQPPREITGLWPPPS